MSIYNKIIELSISTIALASVILNFAFPYVALANNISRNNVLSFDYSKGTSVLYFNSGNDRIVLAETADLSAKTPEGQKTYILSIEPTIRIQTLAKLALEIDSEDAADNKNPDVLSGEERDKIADVVCTEAGITDLPCWQDLKAMREKESFDGQKMTGDGGRSKGWYHIQTKLHGVSDGCAMDFKCSTEWTVKNLIANGYKTSRVYSISRHNGSGVMAKVYAKSIVYNSAKFER